VKYFITKINYLYFIANIYYFQQEYLKYGGEYGENVIPIGSRILKHLIGRKQI